MNKKIMSFVLAVAFVFSIGTNSWAYTHTGTTSGSGVSVSMSSIYNQYGIGEISGAEGQPDDVVEGAESSTNRVCAVFNYASGVVLTVMDQDRNLTIYSAGVAFISLAYSEATGNQGFGYFSVTGVNISGSEYQNVVNNGGLEAFLKKLGVSDSMLQHSKATNGENGTIVVNKDEQEKVGWLGEAESHISFGVNHSISINFTASGGASVTLSVNGKQMDTLGYDYGQTDYVPIATYNYNAAGTLESITQKTYKVDPDGVDHSAAGGTSSDGESAAEAVNKVTYIVAFTEIHMDAWGRQSYATDTNGNIVTTYTYSTTGSIACIHDLTTNNTTWYAAGHASFVLNDSGFKTAEYYYHENGSLDWVCSFNFDEDEGGVFATQGSIYRYGKFLCNINLADREPGQPSNGDEARAALDFMKLHPDEWQKSLEAGAKQYTNIEYTSPVDGTTYYWNGSGWIDKDGNQITDDKEAAVKKAKEEFESKEENKGKTFNEEKEKGKYVEVKKGVYDDLTKAGQQKAKDAVRNTSKFANITNIAIYANDLQNTAFINTYMSMFCTKLENGKLVEDPGAVKAFQQAIDDAVKMSNGTSALGQMTLTIDAVSFETETVKGRSTITSTVNATRSGGEAKGSRVSGEDSTKKTGTVSEVTTPGKVGQQISSKFTVMDHGLQCYQINLNSYVLRPAENQIITTHDTLEVTQVYSSDPVVTGNLVTGDELERIADSLRTDDNDVKVEDGVIVVRDKDGKVLNKYVALENGKINMMEGSGFQALKGEKVLVDVTELSDDEIAEMKSADTVMFMGDVDYAANDKLAIKINREYGDGYKFGTQSAIQNEMDRIERIANGDPKGEATSKDKWITDNTLDNTNTLGNKYLAKLLDEDGKVSLQDLREAWNMLKPNF